MDPFQWIEMFDVSKPIQRPRVRSKIFVTQQKKEMLGHQKTTKNNWDVLLVLSN